MSGFLFILAGVAGYRAPGQPALFMGSLALGTVWLAMGVFAAITGRWLWKIRLRGAIVGILLLIVGILSSYIAPFALGIDGSVLIATELAVNTSLLVLLLMSWNPIKSYGGGFPK